jgi:hypothetical protein
MPAKPDFRDDAVAASEEILAGIDPANAGVSFCLRGAEDGEEFLRSARRRMLTIAGFGIAGIVIGGLIALWLKISGATSESDEWKKLGLALAFSGGGFVLLFTQLAMLRRLVRRRVRERLDALGERAEDLKAVAITLENSFTADTPKLIPEDAGVLILQPEQRSVRIEGLTHRYFIRAEDTLSVTVAGGEMHSSPRVRVAYRIGDDGDVVLDISLTPDSTMKQVGLGLTGKVPALFDQVRACLS